MREWSTAVTCAQEVWSLDTSVLAQLASAVTVKTENSRVTRRHAHNQPWSLVTRNSSHFYCVGLDCLPGLEYAAARFKRMFRFSSRSCREETDRQGIEACHAAKIA
eukprot:scpid61260/ scgid7036/ 